MTELFKILLLFKKPARRLTDIGYFFLGAARLVTLLVTLMLVLFITGVLATFAFTYVPALKDYFGYVTLPDVTGFYSTSILTGMIALVWLAVCSFIIFVAGSLLFLLFMFLGGGLRDE